MNLDAIAAGRQTTSSQQVVVVDTISTGFLKAAPRRVAIIVSAPQTNRVTLSLDPSATLDQGITLQPSTDPLILTVERHGDLVTRRWTAISAIASQPISVIEVFAAN